MTNNNISRKSFASFIAKTGLKRESKRNVFSLGGVKVAYTKVFGDTKYCRQFYDDCDAVLFDKDGVYTVVKRSNLNVDSTPNRITSKGVAARTAWIK